MRGMMPLLCLLLAATLAACGGGRRATPVRSAFDLPPAACTSALRHFTPVPRPAPALGRGACSVPAPVRLEAGFRPPVTTACGMALAWLSFAPEAQRLARRELGSAIVEVRHFGSYACRRMTGNGRRMSLHGSARALDVAGFVLADGRVVDVEDDWGDWNDKGDFLEDLARAACDHFSVVLTPAHDRAHRDHIHLDIGPWKLCGA